MDSIEKVCSLAKIVEITSDQEMLLTIRGLAEMGRVHAQEFDGLDKATAMCLLRAIEALAECAEGRDPD